MSQLVDAFWSLPKSSRDILTIVVVIHVAALALLVFFLIRDQMKSSNIKQYEQILQQKEKAS